MKQFEMKAFHYSCQGASHIATGKVCQDASFSQSDARETVAIVCDGHGGARYFRSDVGAQLAVEATRECVEAFVKEVDVRLLDGKPFAQKLAITSEARDGKPTKDTATDKALRQLFASIIYSWRSKIEAHAATIPLSEKEQAEVEVKYLADFAAGRGVEKTYGCTLMCYVQTATYWFAFHIGDGKCVAFNEAGEWSEPIPWDEQCFLNKTTSLCDASAFDEFRYCYCGDGTFPIATFLGSDGIDDSFGETENMVNFYVQVLKLLAHDEEEQAQASIAETLPQLSQIGSKDDMSIACAYDEQRLMSSVKALSEWQKRETENRLFEVNRRILDLREKLKILVAAGQSTPKSQIDLQYAQTDLDKAFQSKRALVRKWDIIEKELRGDKFEPYNDAIGLSNDEQGKAYEVSSSDDASTPTPHDTND